MSGKGSKRRPPSVPHDTWAANWDAAFKRKPVDGITAHLAFNDARNTAQLGAGWIERWAKEDGAKKP